METLIGPTLSLSLLGPPRMTHSTLGELKESRRKVQALLIWLLLENEQSHSREQLIALFWPEMGREDGLRNLRVTLSRVRKHLAEPTALTATRAEIQLHASPQHATDVSRFEQLIKQTEKHDHNDFAICDRCQANLEEALSLYTGPFLSGFYLDENNAFEEWIFVLRERLHVMGLTQMGRLTEAYIATGRLSQAQAWARRQIELDPLQESAHRQLMHILAVQGDRPQALRQYQICKETLASELGILPDEGTERLRDKIAAGDIKPQIRSQPTDKLPGHRGAAPSVEASNRLPVISTPFFGRESELSLLAKRLTERQYRLISLVGPGGIGKTRLALEAGRQAQSLFKDGIYFVPLVGVESHTDIPTVVAERLGLILATDGHDPLEQVTSYLKSRELLLIIDNLEQIMDGGAELLINWIEHIPHLTLLVTSRERINSQLEDLFRLQGLPYPSDPLDPDAVSYEAVRLFGDRAHRLEKRFWLNEDTLSSVVKICQLVEGLPLALELAATSIREYEVDEIAKLLGAEPELLETDLRDMPIRHRQFETVFDFSWNLLTESEQAVLAKLSLFRGGFTKAAARVVTGSAAVTVTRLRYKSLVRASGNGRLSMHELLRQMASKKLNLSADNALRAELAHSRYFLSLLEEKSPLLVGEKAGELASIFRQDIDNIRTAWHSAIRRRENHQIKTAARPVTDFYTHIGLTYEIENLINQAIVAFESTLEPTDDLLMLLRLLILDIRSIYDHPESYRPFFDQFLGLLKDWTHPKKREYKAKAYFYWSYVMGIGDDLTSGKELCEYALQLAYQLEDEVHLADVLCYQAFFQYRNGQIDAALKSLDAAFKIYEPLGHMKGMSMVEDRLAPAYAENGSYWKGLVHDKRALELYERLGYERRIPKGHQGVAFSYNLLGAYDLARWHLNRSIEQFRRMGNEVGIVDSLSGMAEIETMEGNFSQAIEIYNQCLKRRKADGDYQRFCVEGLKLCRTCYFSGDFDMGNPLIEEIIDWLIKFDNQPDLLDARAAQAMLWWRSGMRDQAISLASNVFNQIDHAKITEPVKTYYELFTVLSEAKHPMASDVIRQAYATVQKLVDEISDDDMRHLFLNNVPFCRWLRKGFAAYNFPTIT